MQSAVAGGVGIIIAVLGVIGIAGAFYYYRKNKSRNAASLVKHDSDHGADDIELA